MNSVSSLFIPLIISVLVVQFTLVNIPRTDAVSLIVAPPKIMSQFNLGFKNLMADILWVRWLQSIDLCAQSGGLNKEVFTSEKQTLELSKNIGNCETGWAYQMLDRITDLNPNFNIAYRFGILSLSVFGKDRQGATLLIEKAMKHHPNDWVMAYRGAYHHMFEDINLEKAANLLAMAARNGAPVWVASLAAKMQMEQSKDEFALKYLLEIRDKFSDSKYQNRIDERISEINKRLGSIKK